MYNKLNHMRVALVWNDLQNSVRLLDSIRPNDNQMVC